MAGTVTQALTEVRGRAGELVAKILTFTCVGDAANGTIPDTDTTTSITAQIKGWFIDKIHTVVGSPGPTADSDVYIKDTDALDLLGGAGVDQLDNATDHIVYPLATLVHTRPLIDGALTLDVDNQAVTEAAYTVKVFIVAGL